MSTWAPRTGFAVAGAVLHALLLREAVVRLFGRRAALVWLLLEPTVYIGLLAMVFSALRVRHVAGMDVGWWIVTGKLAFFLFQRTAFRSTQAIDANRSLLTYRQVKPVDTVFARCILEGLVMAMLAVSTLLAMSLLGLKMELQDPAYLLAALLLLWLLAVGWALCMSIAVAMVPELGMVLSLAGVGVMFISGVMFPISQLPTPWREWLFINPIAHGIEAVRASVSPLYHSVPEMSLGYLGLFALCLVVTGLLLQVRYEQKVVAQ